MIRVVTIVAATLVFLQTSHAQQSPIPKSLLAAVNKRITENEPDLRKLYRYLHTNPELYYQEEQTAARMASELKKLGFTVHTKVGGHGVVGLFGNGDGPTVMVRTDMDALPVSEETGLPYASKRIMRDNKGKMVGVMHACGHDMHMTCWVGVARALVALKDKWSGTLMFIGQPAEEVGAGARMMLADGLFKKYAKPDVAFGLHCNSHLPIGHVSYAEGLLLANVDTVDILVRGKGGHGAAPHTTIDPIVLASRIVLNLQTLVSREVNPLDAAVVTVGSIHGGTKHNIIPNDVQMQLTVRTLKDDVRKQVLEGIVRIAKAAALASKAPEPKITVDLDNFTPAVFNNAKLAKKTAAAMQSAIGKDRVHIQPPIMGGEDFGRYGRAGVPIFFYFLGTVEPKQFMAYKLGKTSLPSLHSSKYAPVMDATIRTGVLSMCTAVLNELKRR